MAHLRPGLHRSKSDSVIAGALGGVAAWLGWNANELRSVYVFLTLVTFGVPGIVAYLALAALMLRAASPTRPAT